MNFGTQTLNITVIFFAALRDLVGQPELSLELSSASMTVEELLSLLLEKFPRLHLEGVRVAVNEEFVEVSQVLRGDDVVALIPPVSGG